ncbi:hypothetical protein LGT39_12505 [Demequina sp. TTPB684]|uniref:hypothetical protein n=1 Tax=unclassified Demequina TaxID=2620311 RepID=UPI001CF48535|nr:MULTISPECIES: hypothetical protein [unclassified Demequina]MCB2413666.1 hypothetical protein [Demequina sp. TTPB684]UPU87728.1 hypothetical protein LGT36_010760 [Demequina sp. TMPB413]
MAEPKVVLFVGTEQQRRYWITQNAIGSDTKVVLASNPRALLGMSTPVDVVHSSAYDLVRADDAALKRAHALNEIFGPIRHPGPTTTTTRICVNCDGPHALADCPLLDPIPPDLIECPSCKSRIDPRTIECACSE